MRPSVSSQKDIGGCCRAALSPHKIASLHFGTSFKLLTFPFSFVIVLIKHHSIMMALRPVQTRSSLSWSWRNSNGFLRCAFDTQLWQHQQHDVQDIFPPKFCYLNKSAATVLACLALHCQLSNFILLSFKSNSSFLESESAPIKWAASFVSLWCRVKFFHHGISQEPCLMLLLLSLLWFINQCCCRTITQTSAALCCQQKRKVIQRWHEFLLLPRSRKSTVGICHEFARWSYIRKHIPIWHNTSHTGPNLAWCVSASPSSSY